MARSEQILYIKGREPPPRPPRIREPRFRHCSKPYSPTPGQLFSCRKCESCIDRIVHDVVGRCLAENWCCEAAFFVSLTIGSDSYYGSTKDNPKAQALCKRDVQGYNKRMLKYICDDVEHKWIENENDPEKFVRPVVRYFYVGEFGDKYGRPHYHLLYFLYGASVLPDMVLDERFFHGKMSHTIDLTQMKHVKSKRTYWPHGFSYIKEFHRNDAYYIAPYCVKSLEQRMSDNAPYVIMPPGRSVRPILGAGYLDSFALRHVDQGLPMRDDGYRLPNAVGYNGPAALFHMNRSSKLFVAERYIQHWEMRHAMQPEFPSRWPRSEFFDRLAENEEQRKRRIWFEGEQFFQRARFQLELNRRVALARETAALVGAYGAIKSGARMWGERPTWTI